MANGRKRGMAFIKSWTGPLADGTPILDADENRARIDIFIYSVGAGIGRISPYSGANPAGHVSGWNSQSPVAFDAELHGAIVTQAWYANLPTGYVISVVSTPYEVE